MGEGTHLKTIFLETYQIVYSSEYLQIGCERHLIDEWWEFDDETIDRMDEQATEFWDKWKDWIRCTIEMSPAKPTKELTSIKEEE